MDWNGAIYVYGKETQKVLKHTSLLAAGKGVLCPGTIRIEDGKVKWLTGRSGHYQPTVDNLVSLLGRLRQYEVDLKDVVVFLGIVRIRDHTKKLPPKPSLSLVGQGREVVENRPGKSLLVS